MTKLDSDKAPQSGRGSEQDRLSQSPLEIRRGSADPTDVTDEAVEPGVRAAGLRRQREEALRERAMEDSLLTSSILVKIVLLRTVAGLVGLGLLVGCGSGGDSNRAIVNTIVLTRDDGSRFAVRGPISFTCGPASGDGPRALRVLVGQRMPGAQQPFWTVQVGLRDLKRKRTFRFPRDGVGGYAVFFAFDAEGGENELSSSEEEASGQIVFHEADCREGADFRIRAHLGSEFFEQPGADVRGRFAAPGS